MRSRILVLLFALGVNASADELDSLIYKLRGLSPPLEAQPAFTKTAPSRTEEPGGFQPALHANNSSSVIFPAGTKAIRHTDGNLQVTDPDGRIQAFPLAYRAFRLPDGTLKVVAPGVTTLITDSGTHPQNSMASPAIATPTPATESMPQTKMLIPSNTTPIDAPVEHLGGGVLEAEGNSPKNFVAVRGLGASMSAKVNGGTGYGNALDSFAGMSLALGRRLNEKYRAEVELAGSTASDGGNKATIASGMANFGYSTPLGGQMSLFLGGGAGILHYSEEFEYTDYNTEYYYSTSYYRYSWYGYYPVVTRHSYRQYYTAEGSGDATLLAGNATAGVSYELDRSVTLDLALRVITTLEGEYSSDEVGDADVQLTLFGGYVGLCFYF